MRLGATGWLSIALGACFVVALAVLFHVDSGLPLGAPAERVGESPERRNVVGIQVTEPNPAAQREARPTAPPPSHRIAVVVVDRAKMPVSGARVRISTPTDSFVALSDDAGHCGFPAVARVGASVLVEITKAGYADYRRECPWTDEVAATLARSVDVHGRVNSIDGSPIPDARIETRRMDGDFPDPIVVSSDENGGFLLTAVPEGQTFLLETTAARFARRIDRFLCDPSAPRTIVVLKPSRETCGIVVDDLGTPIAGARIRREDTNSNESVSSEIGEFCASDMLSSTESFCVLLVQARGHCTTRVPFAPFEDDAARPTIVLPRSAGIAGTVTDEFGAPVKDARIRLQRDFGAATARDPAAQTGRSGGQALSISSTYLEEPPPNRSAKSRADGSFEVRGLLPESPAAVLMVDAQGFEAMISAPIELGGPGSLARCDVTLYSKATVHRGRMIRGTVTLDDAPVAAIVQWRGPGGMGKVVSGDDGKFEISTSESRPMAILAVPIGTDDLQWGRSYEGGDVTLIPTEQSTEEFVIRLRGLTRPIACTVADWTGAVVADCLVEIESRDTHFRIRGRTDANGSVLLSMPVGPSGTLVTASHAGSSTQLPVNPDAESIHVELPRSLDLLVRAVNADSGKHVDQCLWYFRGGKSTVATRVAAQAGSLTTTEPGGWLRLRIPVDATELIAVPEPLTRSLPCSIPLADLPSSGQLVLTCSTGANFCFRFDPPPPPDCRVSMVPVRAEVAVAPDLTGLLDGRSHEQGVVLEVSPSGMAFVQLIAPGQYSLSTDRRDYVIEPAKITIVAPNTVTTFRCRRL